MIWYLRFAIWCLLSLVCLALIAFVPAPQGDIGSHAQAAHLSALHRSGQTFITWSERADLTGELYRVYRASQPITAANLLQATRLYTLPEGSATFYANRYNVDASGVWQYRYLERMVIQDGGAQLPSGTGLLVWTLAAADFANGVNGSPLFSQGGGQAYYAVTVVQGGSETLGAGYSLDTPVAESVADPLPVSPNVTMGDGGHLYIQYMDLRQWNPTFHAPNDTNQYYGLDPSDPRVARAIQYAYDYVVYAPTTDLCNGSIPSKAPVFVSLHGWAGNTYAPRTSNPDPYWCAYGVYPVDQSETWFFGFARHHDYHTSDQPVAGDVIVNYTEQRILRMVYDLIRQPPGPTVDQQRIYVFGGSMGASGTLALALRYPDVFAAAYASEPMTNYSTSGDGGGVDWRSDVAPKWGSLSLNLPVSLSGPSNWAAHLQRYNGVGVWDWQNHQQNLQTRQADGMVPFGIAHGSNDTVIEWSTQGQPTYAAANASRQAWGGIVAYADHTWLSFQGLPPTLQSDGSLTPFAGMRVVRDESVPGLGNASGNAPLPPSPPPPDTTRDYNQTLRWSSSWDAWDGAPVDTASHYQISLCSVSPDPYNNACGTGVSQTVDVTPRRVQRFLITPGAIYTWENRSRAGALVASGTVIADASGLVTVHNFAVSPAGNRLILMRAGGQTTRSTYLPAVLKNYTPTPPAPGAPRPWPDTSSGIHVFNDQLASNLTTALWQFSATHYAGTQKMVRSDAQRLRAINPNFIILHYRLGHALGYRAIQNGCQPTGGWLRIVTGNDWVQEWPGDSVVQESWLYHWPEGSAPRVLNCDWGWYLAEIDNAGWRSWWQGQVVNQIQANQDDGLFMDSLSVPNYLGADRYAPALPAIDSTFESAWSRRIERWLAWLQTQPVGNYYLIPNVGSWITTRDTTDYSAADGVMIEGFAIDADASPYNLEDWQLQMNRALGLIAQNKVVIGQSYVSGAQERMFALGAYLLIKGSRTFINTEWDLYPEWWPEYDIPIGSPTHSAGTAIANLYVPANQVYRRNFSNGFVLVNPTSPGDGTGVTATVNLGGTYYQAQPSGGGTVPANGIPTGTLSYVARTSVTLPPYSAAVLLNQRP